MEQFLPLISGVVALLTLVVLLLVVAKLRALTAMISRLSEQIPGTGMTAKELATELGGSIDEAFKQYVPKPDDLAAALGGAVDQAGKTYSEAVKQAGHKHTEESGKVIAAVQETGKQQIEALNKGQQALAAAASKFTESHQTVVNAAAEKLQGLQKSITDASGNLASGLDEVNGKWQKTLQAHTQELQNALQGASAQISDSYSEVVDRLKSVLDEHGSTLKAAGGGWQDQLTAVFADHAAKVTEANSALVAQLEKVAALEQDISKILHVQETVEGTMKEVVASDEFKALLADLRTHLADTDTLLREASKPRTIRLVESDGELVQTES